MTDAQHHDAELVDEIEGNWYRLARRTQQFDRKMMLFEVGRAMPDGLARHAGGREVFKHTEYFLPSVAHGQAPAFPPRSGQLLLDREEALAWALGAFATRERVASGERLPSHHFAALWPADRAFPGSAGSAPRLAPGYGDTLEQISRELRWVEPGQIAELIVTHHDLPGLTATRLTPALWCATVPMPPHRVDPWLIEELVRLGQWRGVEMARFDMERGDHGALQLLYRQHEIPELAEVLLLGARLAIGAEPSQYLVDVLVEDVEEAELAEPGELPILHPPTNVDHGGASDQRRAKERWERDMEARGSLRNDPLIDERWHGFADRLASSILALDGDLMGGRLGTLSMTTYAVVHGFDGDESPHVRVIVRDGGWYCQIRSGTDDERSARLQGLGIVPRGWGRGFVLAGEPTVPDEDPSDWSVGRWFPSGTSPFEVAHELLVQLTLHHGITADDPVTIHGLDYWFPRDPATSRLGDSWLLGFSHVRAEASSTPEEDADQAPALPPSESPAMRLFEFQVDDQETAMFRCRARDLAEAMTKARSAGVGSPILLAEAAIEQAERTEVARARALDDPMLGPSWMPLIDAIANELDVVDANAPRILQLYAAQFRYDPHVSPYFQFLRQSDGTLLAEVRGPWPEPTSSLPAWEERARMLGWRIRGDEVDPTEEPLLQEQADSPNPTKRFGAHQSGYTIVANVLAMVLFTWEITTKDLFCLVGQPQVLEAQEGFERLEGYEVFKLKDPGDS
ncbi:hypothetical protein [Agrococcus sp. TSP3-2-1]|uniref:hypothetical protein n=1 Tax=Agrococcus sp. TSP3-2-1 TaxID=2804583 RepID=UPI003CEAD960